MTNFILRRFIFSCNVFFCMEIFAIDSLSKNSKVSLFGIKMSFYHAEAICKYVCVCFCVC